MLHVADWVLHVTYWALHVTYWALHVADWVLHVTYWALQVADWVLQVEAFRETDGTNELWALEMRRDRWEKRRQQTVCSTAACHLHCCL